MSELKLVIFASEMVPFAKSGGLADVTAALARHLAMAGHEVRTFIPYYDSIRKRHPEAQTVGDLSRLPLVIDGRSYEFSLLTLPSGMPLLTLYFVDCPAMFARDSLYTNDPDEHRRFILFTRAVIEACQHLRFAPDILHCNDWHTAFGPLYLKTVYSWDRLFTATRSVLTIHNIGYQGVFSASHVRDLGLGYSESKLHQDDLRAGSINALKTGVLYADAVTTVSPNYAREICTTPLGMGLQDSLRGRADPVIGILNGVEYDEWDPRVDPYLDVHFNIADRRGKMKNKRRLIAHSGLQVDASLPMIGMVTRFTEQKGIDLLFDALPRLLDRRQFALNVLGSGDQQYISFFESLAMRYPDRVALRLGYDESLAHLIEAGSDMFLMPSHYEPCGLNQLYSLRYGTIPIVRKTGGLADSVQHFNPASGQGTGVVFEHYDVPAVSWAVNTALDWFNEPLSWRRLMRNAMAQDFSWRRQIRQYEKLYRDLAERA